MQLWILLLACFASSASAALITYDESYFYSRFSNPSETIDFSLLEDNTSFSDLINNSLISPLSTGVYRTTGDFVVRGEAWSNNFLFRGKTGGGFSDATWWNGDSISLFNASRFSIYSFGDAVPLSLNVSSSLYSGFLGIIPDNSADKHYIFGTPDMRINSFSAGFIKSTPIPTPPSLLLFLTGILLLAFETRPGEKGIQSTRKRRITN